MSGSGCLNVGRVRVVGQHRSTEWLSPPVAGEQERQLRQLLVAFSREYEAVGRVRDAGRLVLPDLTRCGVGPGFPVRHPPPMDGR